MKNELSLLAYFASNKVTNILLVFFALNIIVFTQYNDVYLRDWLLITPISLLAINFLAAFINRKVLFPAISLLIFHVALLIFVVLMAIGNLTYLKATVELATGEEFNGMVESLDAGMWHQNKLDKVKFINKGFDINYHKGIKRDKTDNRIAILSENGQQKDIVIGDHIPLVIENYRFYTTHNKGFAPIFTWTPKDKNKILTGSIHLPGYPVHELKQALEWNIPATGKKIWTMLVIQDEILPEDRDFNFTIPEKHYLVIRDEDTRYEMRPGGEIEFDEGILRYEKLDTWMGYKIHYDLSKAWLLGCCIIGVFSLFVHYIKKFRPIFGA
jgi:cytochrome c biogenesis protein